MNSISQFSCKTTPILQPTTVFDDSLVFPPTSEQEESMEDDDPIINRQTNPSVRALIDALEIPSHKTTDLHLPVLNMNDFYNPTLRSGFIKALYTAATTNGFFAVKNVAIQNSVIENGYNQNQLFFNQDESYKKQCSDPTNGGQRGWVPGEKAKGETTGDFKQFMHIGDEKTGSVRNIWPDQPGYKEAMILMYEELQKYVTPLQEAIVEAINLNSTEKLPISYLNDRTETGENNLLRALYYPAVSQEQLDDPKGPPCWGAAHTDIDYMTILPRATEPGLQVEVNGTWLNVVVPEDSFIVNIGDMLEHLTNGLFKSSTHRIIAQEANKERYSMVFFVHPTGTTDLTPLSSCIDQTEGKQLYSKSSRDELLFERLLELGLAPGLLDFYYTTGHIFRQMAYGKESPQVVEMLRNKGYDVSDPTK